MNMGKTFFFVTFTKNVNFLLEFLVVKRKCRSVVACFCVNIINPIVQVQYMYNGNKILAVDIYFLQS